MNLFPNWRSSKVLQSGVALAILIYIPMTVIPWVSALLKPQEFFWAKIIATPFNGTVLAGFIWLWSRMRPVRDLWYVLSPFLFGSVGALYADVLVGLGIIATGGGHGTYLLLGLFSAPFGVCDIFAAVCVPFALWSVAFCLAAFARICIVRRCLVALLIVHYVSALIILGVTEFGDWSYVARSWNADPLVFVNALVVYLAGQGLLVYLIVRHALSSDQSRGFQFSLRTLFVTVTVLGIVLAIAVPLQTFQYSLTAVRFLQITMSEVGGR